MRGWTTLVPLLRDVVARARCAGSLHAAKLDIRAFTSLSHAAPLGAAPPAVTGLRQVPEAGMGEGARAPCMSTCATV